MKKNVVIVAWLLGLAAIAWSCSSSRQGTTHSSTLSAPVSVLGVLHRSTGREPTMKGGA